jgi:hypothetical protein
MTDASNNTAIDAIQIDEDILSYTENPKTEFAMNDQIDHLDQAEQEILTRVAELDQAEEKLLSRDVSDEVLEMSARPCALATMGPGSCVVPGGMIC